MRRIDVNGRLGSAAAALIDETWVANPAALNGDPAAHDAMALGPRLREYLVAQPMDLRSLSDRLQRWRAGGAPAVVRLCPGPTGHGYPLEPWATSPLPEFCERGDLALAFDYSGTPFPWSEVVAFARAFPRLALLALGAPLAGPAAPRAMDAAPNLIFDTSAVSSERDLPALYALVRRCGAYRLTYGSGAGGLGAGEIEAVLRPEDAAMVLYGTAEHLLAGTWASQYL